MTDFEVVITRVKDAQGLRRESRIAILKAIQSCNSASRDLWLALSDDELLTGSLLFTDALAAIVGHTRQSAAVAVAETVAEVAK